MSRFVSTELVPVQLEGDDDIIWILPKMDVGTRKKVKQALRPKVAQDGSYVEVDLEEANWVLLELNAVKWEGPGFDGKPLTPANLRRLDPDDPLLEQVLRQINERNRKLVEDETPTAESVASKNADSASGNTGSKTSRQS